VGFSGFRHSGSSARNCPGWGKEGRKLQEILKKKREYILSLAGHGGKKKNTGRGRSAESASTIAIWVRKRTRGKRRGSKEEEGPRRSSIPRTHPSVLSGGEASSKRRRGK